MFLSEWREFPSAPCLAGKKYLITTRVSMLLKSRASLTCFRACFLPGRAKYLSAPRHIQIQLRRTVYLHHSKMAYPKMFPDVSKNHGVFVSYRVKQSYKNDLFSTTRPLKMKANNPSKRLEPRAHRHRVTCQKTCLLNHTAA